MDTTQSEQQEQRNQIRRNTSHCYTLKKILKQASCKKLIFDLSPVGYEMLFLEWCRLVSALSTRAGLVGSRYKMVEGQAKNFPISKYYILLQTVSKFTVGGGREEYCRFGLSETLCFLD